MLGVIVEDVRRQHHFSAGFGDQLAHLKSDSGRTLHHAREVWQLQLI